MLFCASLLLLWGCLESARAGPVSESVFHDLQRALESFEQDAGDLRLQKELLEARQRVSPTIPWWMPESFLQKGGLGLRLGNPMDVMTPDGPLSLSSAESVLGGLRRFCDAAGEAYCEAHIRKLAAYMLRVGSGAWKARIPGGVSPLSALRWGSSVEGGVGEAGEVPASLWGRYWLSVRRLEEELEKSGEFVKEGHTGEFPVSSHFLLSGAMALPEDALYCEIGFNSGHSAMAVLTANPSARVLSFDFGMESYAYAAERLLQRWFPGRLEVVWGDSMRTISDALGVGGWLRERGDRARCDVWFVDGGHKFHEALSDISAVLEAVALDNLSSDPQQRSIPLLIDDCMNGFIPGVTQAAFRAIESRHIALTRTIQSPRLWVPHTLTIPPTSVESHSLQFHHHVFLSDPSKHSSLGLAGGFQSGHLLRSNISSSAMLLTSTQHIPAPTTPLAHRAAKRLYNALPAARPLLDALPPNPPLQALQAVFSTFRENATQWRDQAVASLAPTHEIVEWTRIAAHPTTTPRPAKQSWK